MDFFEVLHLLVDRATFHTESADNDQIRADAHAAIDDYATNGSQPAERDVYAAPGTSAAATTDSVGVGGTTTANDTTSSTGSAPTADASAPAAAPGASVEAAPASAPDPYAAPGTTAAGSDPAQG